MSTMNDVRQILMNELGLTRESVRLEVETVVRDTVQTFLNSDRFDKALHRVIAETLDTWLKKGQYDREMLKRTVGEAVQKELMNRLTIQVAVKS